MLSEVCSPPSFVYLSQDYAVGNLQFYAAFVNYHAAFDECPHLRGSVAMVRDGSAHFLAGEQAAKYVNLALSFLLHRRGFSFNCRVPGASTVDEVPAQSGLTDCRTKLFTLEPQISCLPGTGGGGHGVYAVRVPPPAVGVGC